MAGLFKLNHGKFIMEVWARSFKVTQTTTARSTGNIYTGRTLDMKEAQEYLMNFIKFWEDSAPPRPMTWKEMSRAVEDDGQGLTSVKLRSLTKGGPFNNIHAKAGEECEKLLDVLDEFQVWEPADEGAMSRQARASQLFTWLEDAYLQGKLAGKSQASKAITDLILKS